MPASRRKHSPIPLEKDEINPRQIQGKMVVTAGNSFEVAPSVFQRSDNFFDILSRALRDFNFRDADALYPISIYLDKAMAQRLLSPRVRLYQEVRS